MNNLTRKELIILATRSLAMDLLVDDRKYGGTDLHPGEIEKAIDVGEITADEIVSAFAYELDRMLLERELFEKESTGAKLETVIEGFNEDKELTKCCAHGKFPYGQCPLCNKWKK